MNGLNALSKPYVGLVPYEEEQAPYFFGRDADRESIIASLLATRLTVLYGASGVGKSSVLRAGVLHRLRRLTDARRAEGRPPGLAVVVFNTWRDDPLPALLAAVERAVAEEAWGGRAFAPLPPDTPLAAALQTWAERTARDPAVSAVDGAGPDPEAAGDLLIILDQFEEYFQYHDQEPREPFAAQLVEAVNRRNLRTAFLISLREDALAKLDRFQAEIPGLFDSCLRVEHLDEHAARDAITGPVGRYNERGADGAGLVTVEEDLVRAVLAQVRTGQLPEPGAERDDVAGVIPAPDPDARIETPFLQLVMLRLWDEEMAAGSRALRAETLDRLGGAREIWRTHLDASLGVLDAGEREVAAAIFRHLVTASGTKIAYTVADLVDLTNLPAPRIAPVMDRMAGSDMRILRTVAAEGPQPATRYEIFHDVLAAPIRDWRRRVEQARAEAAARQELLDEQLRAKAKITRLYAVVAGLAVLLGVVLGLTVYAFNQRRVAVDQRRVANERAEQLRDALADAQVQRRQALGRQIEAQAAVLRTQRANLLPRSVLLAIESYNRTSSLAAADTLRRALALLPRPVARLTHGSYVNAVAFSPDGRRWATAGQDGVALLWDADTRQVTARLPHGGDLLGLAFSDDGRYLATAGTDGVARLWETGNPARPLREFRHGAAVRAVAFGGESRMLATAGADGAARVWPVAGGDELFHVSQGADLWAVTFSTDGRLLATGGSDRGALVWDVATHDVIRQVYHEHGVWSVALSPDGRYAASASSDHTVKVWEVRAERELLRLSHEEGVYSVAFSPDGRYLATGSWDRTARVWEFPSGREIARMVHDGDVRAVAFDRRDGRLLLTGASTGEAVLWEPFTTWASAHMAHADKAWGVAFSHDGRSVATASADGSARVWQAATGSPVSPWLRHDLDNGIWAIAFSPDDRQVATASTDGTARVWEVAGGRELQRMSHGAEVTSIAFSEDGRLLATGDGAGVARVWDATRSEAEITRVPHGDRVISVALSPNGRYLATGSRDHTARVWDLADGNREVLRLDHDGDVQGVAFSPDSRLLATGSADRAARLWRVPEGGPPVAVMPHEATVRGVAFSRDGRYLATGSYDKTARVWLAPEGSEVARLTADDLVLGVDFDESGNHLAVGGWDGSALAWPIWFGDLKRVACERLLRNLLPDDEWRHYLVGEPYEKTCPDLP